MSGFSTNPGGDGSYGSRYWNPLQSLNDIFGWDTKDFNREMAQKNYDLALRQQTLSEQSFEYQKWYDANNVQLKMQQYAENGINPILATEGGQSTAVGTFQGGSPTPSLPDSSSGLGGIASILGSILNKSSNDNSLRETKREFNAQIQEQSEQFYAKLHQEKEENEKNRATSIANTQFIARSNEAINKVSVDMQKEIRKEEMSYENMNKSLDRALQQYLKSIDVKENELNREQVAQLEEEKNKVLRSNANKALTGNIISAFLHSVAIVLTGGVAAFVPGSRQSIGFSGDW